jgi:2,4-dienoyl-CoA reductase-like NADH-dependent reductase (Old Yellow Enzyme family)
MPDLFTPFTLKDVTLRNRIAMSPMTMYRTGDDGRMTDFHVMLMGSRAAGGFGLVFPEQIAITPDGRTWSSCAGIWEDGQIEGLSRVTAIIKAMGGTPAIQLGHTGRKGSETEPWSGKAQATPEQGGWPVRGPSPIPFGGRFAHPVHELSRAEIAELHQAYAAAARRALAAGFEWLELHFAHGYLGASFFSPLANQRTDEYGGSLENRLRFHREAMDAVRAVWPERLPLTIRLGCDDFHPDGVQFDEAVWAVGELRGHGLDLADLSLGMNTDAAKDVPFGELAFMVERGARVRRETGVPVGVSWNLGVPAVADRVIREGLIDLVLLGRPALANPHWPFYAARELAQADPLSLLPEDWSWWLRRIPGPEGSQGWPAPAQGAPRDL